MTSPVLFQALPPLDPDEYRALEESILQHGVQVPIIVDENGVVIDGHHRQKITRHHGLPCPEIVQSGYTDNEKRTLALSLNLDRRQLTKEQKQALYIELRKQGMSYREIADATGVADTTVMRNVATAANAAVELPETIIGKDGKERAASKPKPAEPEFLPPGFNPGDLDALNTPVPEMPKAKRRPITDQARDAAIELQKAIERIERILEDDRCDKNKQELGLKLRGTLQYTNNVCETTLTYLDGEN